MYAVNTPDVCEIYTVSQKNDSTPMSNAIASMIDVRQPILTMLMCATPLCHTSEPCDAQITQPTISLSPTRRACCANFHTVLMLLTFKTYYYWYSITLTLSFEASNLPFLQIFPTVAFLFFFSTDSTNSPDFLPIFRSISVFYLL